MSSSHRGVAAPKRIGTTLRVAAAVVVAAALVPVVRATMEKTSSAHGAVMVTPYSTPLSTVDVPGIAPAKPLEPDVQTSPNSLGCRSTSLIGQVLEGPQYLVLTEPGDTVAADWFLDGAPFGTSSSAPFVPVDGAGAPIPVPVGALAVGAHEIEAQLHSLDGTSRLVYGNFVVPGADGQGGDGVTAIVSVNGAAPSVLEDWSLLEGSVSFAVLAPPGPADLQIDGQSTVAGQPLDTAMLAAGRHVLQIQATAADGTALNVTRVFVTNGGRPPPAPCSLVEVADYGAVGDGVADDTGALVSAIDVAMAAGATVHLPAGTFAVPTLKNVLLPRELAISGDPGAVLDAGRPGEKYSMFLVDASVTFSGIAVRNAGKLFSFDQLGHRVDRFVIERSAFTDVYSPAHVKDPPPQQVELILLADNTVERAVKGFYLPLSLIGHARARGNTITDVGDAAIRLGSDIDAFFSTQRDIDVRENVIRHVTGPSDANGIKVMGGDGVIVLNSVEDVASDDGTDAEGIYTKGFGHLIAANTLRDAGRTQAQITVKSDSTTVADNTIITELAATNGVRIEGSNVTVKGNTISGGGPEFIGITTKLLAGFGGYVFEDNVFVDSAGTGISTGGDGPIVIRGNRFSGMTGTTAVEVRATKASTTDIEITANIVEPMSAPSSRAFSFEARTDQTMSAVRISANTVTDVANGAVFALESGAKIRDVVAEGNSWIALRGETFVGEENVEGFIPG